MAGGGPAARGRSSAADLAASSSRPGRAQAIARRPGRAAARRTRRGSWRPHPRPGPARRAATSPDREQGRPVLAQRLGRRSSASPSPVRVAAKAAVAASRNVVAASAGSPSTPVARRHGCQDRGEPRLERVEVRRAEPSPSRIARPGRPRTAPGTARGPVPAAARRARRRATARPAPARRSARRRHWPADPSRTSSNSQNTWPWYASRASHRPRSRSSRLERM